MKKRHLLVLAAALVFTTAFSFAGQIDPFADIEERVGAVTDEEQMYGEEAEEPPVSGVMGEVSEMRNSLEWFDFREPKKEYNISSEAQLIYFASLVNEEQPYWKETRLETFEGVTFNLTRDIKLTEKWTPVGSTESNSFKGSFNGNGHTISNMIIDESGVNSGFFGYLSGEVKDLTVEGRLTSTYGDCGGIAGKLDPAGKVKKCTARVDIAGQKKTGGIVGNNAGGTIEECLNFGDVSGTFKVGGVAGENWGGIITKCGNEGKVTSKTRGVSTYGTGGIAGRSVAETAVISECYNTGDIVSGTEATGGVAGYTNAAESSVTESYNTGDIEVLDSAREQNGRRAYAWAGGVIGVVGTDGVVVADCYGAGDIKGADVTGGVIGKYIAGKRDTPETHIKNNYYVKDRIEYGIGKCKDEGAADIKKCATGVSGGNLSGMASALSIGYMKNSAGIYGADGYPALRWQEPVNRDEKPYMENISKDVQKSLDNYLINNTDVTNKGDMIISVFNPDKYITDAILTYNKELDEEKAQQDKDKDIQERAGE